MESMKNCPHCGKEILATAKKCKYCGQWLEKKCPCCGEWILIDAKKCKYCNTWLNKFSREKYEGTPVQPSSPAPSISEDDIADAIEDREDSEVAGCLMSVELGGVMLLAKWLLGWSWWGFIGFFVLGYLLLCFRFLRIIYCIAVSIVWAIIGCCLAPLILGDSDLEMLSRFVFEDYSSYWWIAAIFGILSLILHWPAMRSHFNF